MDTAVIPMLINSDFMEIPLDKRLDLADYKMYGEKSHVFQNKDRLHSLYETTGLTMNDLTINGETLEYFVKKNKTGIALASVYGIENVNTLVTLTAMTAVANSSTAMQAVLNSSTAMQAVLNSSTAMTAVANSRTAMTMVLNSSTAMTAVLNSSTAMTAVANSSTAMTAVANNSTAMTAVANSSVAVTKIANSQVAIDALSKSNMRTRLTYGKKVENGLLLVMSTGGQTYFSKDFNNTACSYLKFIDGTVYPSLSDNDMYLGVAPFGEFLKRFTKTSVFARTYYQFDDCWMDVILIKGTITNAR